MEDCDSIIYKFSQEIKNRGILLISISLQLGYSKGYVYQIFNKKKKLSPIFHKKLNAYLNTDF